jgi:hypothetical protein
MFCRGALLLTQGWSRGSPCGVVASQLATLAIRIHAKAAKPEVRALLTIADVVFDSQHPIFKNSQSIQPV